MTAADGRGGPRRPVSPVVVAVPHGGGRAWADLARSLDDAGWDALLVPDTTWTTSPFPALAAAAAVTSRIRLRPWVVAAPLRAPSVTAREAAAVQELSDGRLELGVGTGRPDARRDAERLGVPWPDGAGRRRLVAETVAAVRERVAPVPPVVIAASGPLMTREALHLLTAGGDRLALAVDPATDAAGLAAATAALRDRPAPALTYQLTGIGDLLPEWLRSSAGLDAERLRAAGAVGLLPADPDRAAEELRGWPGRFGIDEVVVPLELTEAFAPVLRRLDGGAA